jgi:hypothetical protein
MSTPDQADRVSQESTIGAVCEVCRQGAMVLTIVQAGVPYHECVFCGLIVADCSALPTNLSYGADYWKRELRSTRRRSWSTSVQRVGEVFALCGIEIKTFIDISTGGGELMPLGPTQMRKMQLDEVERFREIIKTSGFKPE